MCFFNEQSVQLRYYLVKVYFLKTFFRIYHQNWKIKFFLEKNYCYVFLLECSNVCKFGALTDRYGVTVKCVHKNGCPDGFYCEREFCCAGRFFFNHLKKEVLNRVYIKGDHVDYVNERFSFSIENVFVIVKYKEIIKMLIIFFFSHFVFY